MAIRKILCAIDFSEGARQALHTAVRIANDASAELVIASSWYVAPISYSENSGLAVEAIEQLAVDTERGLAEAALDATASGTERVSTRMLRGPEWQAVVAFAKSLASDLCVIGTHGRSGLARVVLGSIAEQIVRHSSTPVLVVRPDNPPEPYRRALVPVDFSDCSLRAAELALDLIHPVDGEITLLHVIELLSGASEATAQEYERIACSQLEAWMASIQSRTTARVLVRTVIGRPGATILDVASEPRAPDVVLLGSQGRTGLERMVLGSVAEKIVRYAKCPVVVAYTRPQLSVPPRDHLIDTVAEPLQ